MTNTNTNTSATAAANSLPMHVARVERNTLNLVIGTDKVFIELVCPHCGRAYSVSYPIDGFKKWASGAHVQDALPNATPTEREYLITCLCEKCQEEIFG